jgi:hypothetical protein
MIDAHSAVEPVPQQEQARARDKAGELVGISMLSSSKRL